MLSPDSPISKPLLITNSSDHDGCALAEDSGSANAQVMESQKLVKDSNSESSSKEKAHPVSTGAEDAELAECSGSSDLSQDFSGSQSFPTLGRYVWTLKILIPLHCVFSCKIGEFEWSSFNVLIISIYGGVVHWPVVAFCAAFHPLCLTWTQSGWGPPLMSWTECHSVPLPCLTWRLRPTTLSQSGWVFNNQLFCLFSPYALFSDGYCCHIRKEHADVTGCGGNLSSWLEGRKRERENMSAGVLRCRQLVLGEGIFRPLGKAPIRHFPPLLIPQDRCQHCHVATTCIKIGSSLH